MKHLATFILFLGWWVGAFSQNEYFDPTCNSFTHQVNRNDSSFLQFAQKAEIAGRSSGMSCSANTFWVVNSSDEIEQLEINGSVITNNGVIIPSFPGVTTSLSFCNNLDGGSFSPTMYSSSFNSLFYWDGVTWVTANATSNMDLYNGGGNGDFLYFLGGPGYNTTIARYNGNSFDTIYDDSNVLPFAAADIAVDDSGNVFCLRGLSAVADYIDIISPTGQILKRYNVSLDCGNAYGCFLLDSTFYVGLGSSNSVHPNTLIPFNLTIDSAIQGSPINMPLGSTYDLASCFTRALIFCSIVPPTIVANNLLVCASDSAEICAPSGFTSYLWNTGETTACIKAKLAGNYYVTVTDNNGCTAESNRIAISVYPLPPVSISVNGDTLSVYGAVTQQWYLNGSAINNATSNIYMATQGGIYTVMVTDTNGCTATSSAVIISGIDNVTEDDVVSVFHMGVDRWQLTVGNSWLGSIAEVFDANGRVVFKSAINNLQSEIAPDVSKGVYLLRISSGKSSVVRKLIRL